MEENKNHTSGMLKNEYAKLVGIPVSTLRNYMNKLFLGELMALNYSRCQKYLTPVQINYLNSKLVVIPEP